MSETVVGREGDVPGGLQITIQQTFEVEGGTKPVCVAESLARVFGG